MDFRFAAVLLVVFGILIGYTLLPSSNFSSNVSVNFILTENCTLSYSTSSEYDEIITPPFNVTWPARNMTAMSATMENLCERERCIGKFQRHAASAVRYLPQYKLATCSIPKSLSTIIQTMMCYLNDPRDFESRGLTMTTGPWKDRVCRGRGSQTRGGLKIDYLVSSYWTHVVVVRDPIDRLISGFLNKCIIKKEKLMYGRIRGRRTEDAAEKYKELNKKWCLGCRDNLTCFIRKNYEHLMYPVVEKYPMENHFYPQNWFCLFSTFQDYFKIIKVPTEMENMEYFYESIASILHSRRVPQEHIANVTLEMSTHRTAHTTSHTNTSDYYRNWLYNDKELLKIVVKTYFYDFVLFDFEFPQL